MLSRQENQLLTQTGPDTPLGQMYRRYWIPALLSEEIEPDGAPAEVRLLGETFAAFRDSNGRVINPTIVEGQVHGAAAHGIGAALMETCAYSSDGNLLTSTFSSYTPITSLNMPTLRCGHLETPSPHSYNGAKGMGEGGAAPLHTLSAALQDALYSSGVIIADSHNTPDSIFQALARARREGRDPNVRSEKIVR